MIRAALLFALSGAAMAYVMPAITNGSLAPDWTFIALAAFLGGCGGIFWGARP